MFYGYKDFTNLTFITKFSRNNAFIHFVTQIFNLNYNIGLWCLILKPWVWFLPYFWVRSDTERWHNFDRTFHFVFALFLRSTDCCLVETTENSELNLTEQYHCVATTQYGECFVQHDTNTNPPPNSLRRVGPLGNIWRIPIFSPSYLCI